MHTLWVLQRTRPSEVDPIVRTTSDRAGPVELEVRDQLLFLEVFGSGVAVVDVQEYSMLIAI